MSARGAPLAPSRVFLDANILFSAALAAARGDNQGPFGLLWALAIAGKLRLASSNWCVGEAEFNLRRKKPAEAARLTELVASLELVPDPREPGEPAASLLPAKDAPVLAAALVGGCQFLITGDERHFGALMARDDLPLRVRSLRRFLVEGP